MRFTIEIEASSLEDLRSKFREFAEDGKPKAAPTVRYTPPAAPPEAAEPQVAKPDAPAPAPVPAPAAKQAPLKPVSAAVPAAPAPTGGTRATGADQDLKLMNGKELSKHKISELQAIAASHDFSVAGFSRAQIELAVSSLVFGDGSTARELRSDIDVLNAPAPAAPAAKRGPGRPKGSTKKAAEPEPEDLMGDEIDEGEPEPEPVKPAAKVKAAAPPAQAPAVAKAPKAAAPAPKAAAPAVSANIGADHIPEEPDYSDLVEDEEDEEGSAEEEVEEDEPAEETEVKINPKAVPDFIKTAPKLTTIVAGISKLHKETDPDKIVALLKAYAPFSPKIQQSLDSITTLRIKGILSMAAGR